VRAPVPLPDHLKDLQPHIKQTQAGIVIDRHDHKFNAHSQSAALLAASPDHFVVDAHGTASKLMVGERDLSVRDTADVIRASGWDGEQPILLVGCQTGSKADGFAAQLSHELGAEVVAPTKDAWIDDRGNLFASSAHLDGKHPDFRPGWPPNGQWATFKPDGTNAPHTQAHPPGHTPDWRDASDNGPRNAYRRGEHDSNPDTFHPPLADRLNPPGSPQHKAPLHDSAPTTPLPGTRERPAPPLPPGTPLFFENRPEFRATPADAMRMRESYPQGQFAEDAAKIGEVLARNPHLRHIVPDQLIAVRGYTAHHSFETINKAFREHDLETLRRHEAQIRCVNSALNQMPVFQGRVHRVINTRWPDARAAQYPAGAVVTERAFLSGSAYGRSTFPGKVELHINSRTGRDISAVSHRSGEREILFPTGTQFRVVGTGFDKNTGTYHIQLDEVPPRVAAPQPMRPGPGVQQPRPGYAVPPQRPHLPQGPPLQPPPGVRPGGVVHSGPGPVHRQPAGPQRTPGNQPPSALHRDQPPTRPVVQPHSQAQPTVPLHQRPLQEWQPQTQHDQSATNKRDSWAQQFGDSRPSHEAAAQRPISDFTEHGTDHQHQPPGGEHKTEHQAEHQTQPKTEHRPEQRAEQRAEYKTAQQPQPAQTKPLSQRLGELADERLDRLRPHMVATEAGMSMFDKANERNHSWTAGQLKRIPGYFVLDLHGMPAGVRAGTMVLSHNDIGDILDANPDYDGKTPILVTGCQTGKQVDGFAAKLAGRMGVEVTAPRSDAWIDYDGNMFAAEIKPGTGEPRPTWPPNGEWATYDPQGRQHVQESPYPPSHTPTWGHDEPVEAPSTAYPRGPEVDAALDTAAEGRTDSGAVDPGTIDALVESLPPIHTDGTDLHARLTDFVGDALDQGPVELRPVGGGGAKGVSGAPVFLVRDESGAVTAVTKVFPDTVDFARDLSSLERLSSLDLSFDVAQPLAVGMIHSPEGLAGTVVYAVAPGKPIDDLISDTASATGEERVRQVEDLSTAVRQTAQALAELHTQPDGSGGEVGRLYLDNHRQALQARVESLLPHRELLLKAGLDVDELHRRAMNTIEATRVHPGVSAYAHGDAHPGNFFWDKEKGVTFIDTTTVHYSIGEDSRPIGSAERDLGNFEQWLTQWGREFGLSLDEVGRLRADFSEAYEQAGGQRPTEDMLALFALRSSLTPVVNAVHEVREMLEQPEDAEATGNATAHRNVMRELRQRIRQAKGTLGWES
jgi:hypothetical protein